MTIYIDIVLIENLIMNYIILCATSIIMKLKINYIRIFIGSLIGAIYAVISYMSTFEAYSTLVLKIILSIIIVYISFNPQTVKKLLKEVLIFYLTSFLFGGVAFSLLYFINPKSIISQNGVLVGTYPIKMAILGAIIGSIIIITSFKIVKSKVSNKDMFCNIEIKINGKKVKTKAMIDTGNLLKEPITNIPVVVVEHTLLYDVIPKQILNNLENILGGEVDNISENIKKEYILKLKIIPYSSLGKQNGMLLGIKAENIVIEKDEEEIKNDNIIIGIYNKSLTKKGEYRALIGIDLLNE